MRGFEGRLVLVFHAPDSAHLSQRKVFWARKKRRDQARLSDGRPESHSGGRDQISVTPVLDCRNSRVTPGASSTTLRPSGVTSITARSVMMRSTTPTPVSGSVHCGRIFR